MIESVDFKRLILRAVLHNVSPMVIRRATRSRTLCEFQLRPAETFLYTCGAVDLWEWEIRLLDACAGSVGEDAPLCLGGRGAAPPQYCGGPTGYRLMLKRQRMGEAMCTPMQMEAVLGMLTASDPKAPDIVTIQHERVPEIPAKGLAAGLLLVLGGAAVILGRRRRTA